MTSATVLACAMVLDACFGEPNWLWKRLPHPAVLMGRLVGALDIQLNQGTRRRLRGLMCTVLLLAVGIGAGKLMSTLGPLAETLCVAILLAQKSLVEHVGAVAKALHLSDEAGRQAVSMIVSRDTSEMTSDHIARAAIESGAENLSDGVIAPAFWFLVAGLPGILVYKLINTADSMIGYRTAKYEEFGWAAARMDDLLNLIPARLTAVLIALPARLWNIKAIAADASLHRSPNAGWPEAAMSRAIGIALSGPRSYDGKMQQFPWVNPTGRKTLSPLDIDTCTGMLWKAWGVFFLAVTLFAFLTL